MSRIMSFEVDDQLYDAIKAAAARAECSMSEYIRSAVSNCANVAYSNQRVEHRLRILLDASQMSQSAVAKKHNISRQRVGQIIHGRYSKD